MSEDLRGNLWRAAALVVFCLVCSGAIALIITAVWPAPQLPDESDELAARMATIEYPRADLSPAEVVRIQLAACADRDWGRGSLQCFSFASPDNRAVTGPLARFGQMLRQPPFDVLSAPDRVLIGEPKLVKGTSRILVTVAKDEKVAAFVWLLQLQTEPPFDGCWMTGAVLVVQSPKDNQSPEDDRSPNSENLPINPHPLDSGGRTL